LNRHLVHLLLALVVAAGCRREPPPSQIFHTGKIVTVDPRFRTVEAMAIRDGHILALGTNADIARLAGPGTAQEDVEPQDLPLVAGPHQPEHRRRRPSVIGRAALVEIDDAGIGRREEAQMRGGAHGSTSSSPVSIADPGMWLASRMR